MKELKLALFICISCFFGVKGIAQDMLSPASIRNLQLREDTMRKVSDEIIQGINASDRFRADSQFIRVLMRALPTTYSYYYPFDSLRTISIQYPEDSSFRIFTWQFMRDDNYFRQRGAIQMNTKDGSLVIHPLFDASEFTDRPEDSVRTARNWIGAIYYKIIQKEHDDKKYYTLIGFDDNSIRSTKKWMDVLHFDAQGKPLFGGDFFSYQKDSIPRPTTKRFSMEYKKNARARLNYDEEMEMIMVDHLVSEISDPSKKYTLIPDGDYEGFTWQSGQWLHIDKVFDFKLKDGEAPVGDQLLGDDGKEDEEKLKKSSEKNRKKKNLP